VPVHPKVFLHSFLPFHGTAMAGTSPCSSSPKPSPHPQIPPSRSPKTVTQLSIAGLPLPLAIVRLSGPRRARCRGVYARGALCPGRRTARQARGRVSWGPGSVLSLRQATYVLGGALAGCSSKRTRRGCSPCWLASVAPRAAAQRHGLRVTGARGGGDEGRRLRVSFG
jgi:hypothetical protein